MFENRNRGSPRAMAQNYYDAMSIVKRFGKPAYFITMTANPKWEEIKRELFTQETDGHQLSQESVDREDITTRVFNQKKKTLVEAISKGQRFQTTRQRRTVKFQVKVIPEYQRLQTTWQHCILKTMVEQTAKLESLQPAR